MPVETDGPPAPPEKAPPTLLERLIALGQIVIFPLWPHDSLWALSVSGAAGR